MLKLAWNSEPNATSKSNRIRFVARKGIIITKYPSIPNKVTFTSRNLKRKYAETRNNAIPKNSINIILLMWSITVGVAIL